MTIIVDSGLLLAAANRRDQLHQRAVRWLAQADEELMVVVPVVVETAWQIEDVGGPEAESGFLASIRSGDLQRVDLTDDDWERVEALVARYADLGLGTVDASIVAVAERLGVTQIATFNHRDFRVVRPSHVDAFEIVP